MAGTQVPVSQDDLLQEWDDIRTETCPHIDPQELTDGHPCWDCVEARREEWAEKALAYLEASKKFYGMVKLYVEV